VEHSANLEMILVLIKKIVRFISLKRRGTKSNVEETSETPSTHQNFPVLHGCFFQMSKMDWPCDSNLRCLFWSNPLPLHELIRYLREMVWSFCFSLSRIHTLSKACVQYKGSKSFSQPEFIFKCFKRQVLKIRVYLDHRKSYNYILSVFKQRFFKSKFFLGLSMAATQNYEKRSTMIQKR
jgi:hypothetical protein